MIAENLPNATREYVVNNIALHVACGNIVGYIIHCCSHKTADDTVKQPEHIPEHFIIRYWGQMQEKQQVKEGMEVPDIA